MYKNPLAKVIRQAFIENVNLNDPQADAEYKRHNSIENIMQYKRITLIEKALNKFLINSNQPPVPEIGLTVDEKGLLSFTLFISGYLRDNQEVLNNLEKKYACDIDLINLYKAAAKYAADCTGRIKDNKYIYKEHFDFHAWKVENPTNLQKAAFNENFEMNPSKRNLILSMPFHTNPTEQDLQKWSDVFLKQAVSNPKIFGSKVDVYLTHFPMQQPKGEKFYLTLDTIRRPETFFCKLDMNFVKAHLLPFIGQNIKLDNKNRIVAGTAYDDETFKRNLKNLTILSYCSGTAHAHRFVNAVEHIARQLYSEKTTTEALKQIFVISYAFLPVSEKLKYSGVHIMSNYPDDTLRKEPFVKMFNPELYEDTKYKKGYGVARIGIMPDNKNYTIAFPLPQIFTMIDETGQIVPLPNVENGHHMGLITQPNAATNINRSHYIFKKIVEKASLGYRGKQIENMIMTLADTPKQITHLKFTNQNYR